jgi:hypothetical protein
VRAAADGEAERTAVAARLRPFYFTVVFWGPVYRQYFTDLLLGSLLAPGNIPALNRARNSAIVIATTPEDWDALRAHPLMNEARSYVELVWLPFNPGAEAHRNDRKMSAMSRGQAMLATRAFNDRAYGMYLTPDAMFADGSIAALERLVDAGKKVVFAIAVRFQYEGAVEELRRRGHLAPGRVLTVPPRELMRVVLRHLHTETLRYDYDAPWFAEVPISPYWRLDEGDGLIFHTFSWAPLVIDYAALASHDISTFEHWTLDGDYVYRNFPNASDVYVVTDSDEVAYVSFTREADLHFEMRPDLARFPRWLIRWYKAQLIRKLKDSSIMDPLKRDIFPTPVYFHADDIPAAFERARQRAADVIADVYAPPRRTQRLMELRASLRAPGLVARIGPVNPRLRDALWCYQYRRFLWQRVKEKTGWSRGRSRLDDGRDWISPTLGLMNPIWTWSKITGDAHYRRAAGGLVLGWGYRTFLRPILFAVWAWVYRRYCWQRFMERTGRTPGRSRLGDGKEWRAPAVGVMNPLWTVRVVFGDRARRKALIDRFWPRPLRGTRRGRDATGRFS